MCRGESDPLTLPPLLDGAGATPFLNKLCKRSGAGALRMKRQMNRPGNEQAHRKSVTGCDRFSDPLTNRFTGDEPRTSRGKGRFADRPRPDLGLRPEKKAWAFSPKNSRNGRHYTEWTKGVTGGATRGRVKAVSRKHVRRMGRPAMRSERRTISTKDASGSGREKGGPRGGKLSSISRRFRDKPRKRAREISEAGRVKGTLEAGRWER